MSKNREAPTGLTGKLYGVRVNHHYLIKSGLFSSEIERTEHACLRLGYWCWPNLLQRPQDIRRYFRARKNRKLWQAK